MTAKARTLKQVGEWGLIRRIRGLTGPSRGIPLAIGDDAAALPHTRSRYLLFTTDCLVDGVDFRLSRDRPEAIGWKALAQNLSDIAAMGGRPLWAVAALGLPERLDPAFVERFYRGMIRLARRTGTRLVGGDLSRSRTFFASLAVLGQVDKRHLARRGGARRGDWIFVTGSLGGSILGRHLAFVPRLREAAELTRRYRVHAMIDVSDGFLEDLRHILGASGKGARVVLSRIPISREARMLARRTGRDALRAALTDGEDFELLFTLSEKDGRRLLSRGRLAGTPVHWVGRVTERRLVFVERAEDAREKRIAWRGFRHF